jgi:molybdopterin-containing oxidoreductase family iron-sulfur binding subunit
MVKKSYKLLRRKEQEVDQSKRSFISGLVAASGLTVAPGVFLYQTASAKPAEQAVSNAVRWGMLVDVNQCTEDCDACVTACNEEHGLSATGLETDSQWIRKLTVKDPTTDHSKSFPVMCQHCEHPPCVDVCPTGASFKREDGIVLVNMHTCIGCRYCMMACPYKARSFVHETLENQLPSTPRGKGCVESCNMCVHKVDAGEGTTACAEACQKDGHQAITFGDLNDPESEISIKLRDFGGTQIRADLGLNTGVRYQGL